MVWVSKRNIITGESSPKIKNKSKNVNALICIVVASLKAIALKTQPFILSGVEFFFYFFWFSSFDKHQHHKTCFPNGNRLEQGESFYSFKQPHLQPFCQTSSLPHRFPAHHHHFATIFIHCRSILFILLSLLRKKEEEETHEKHVLLLQKERFYRFFSKSLHSEINFFTNYSRYVFTFSTFWWIEKFLLANVLNVLNSNQTFTVQFRTFFSTMMLTGGSRAGFQANTYFRFKWKKGKSRLSTLPRFKSGTFWIVSEFLKLSSPDSSIEIFYLQHFIWFHSGELRQ